MKRNRSTKRKQVNSQKPQKYAIKALNKNELEVLIYDEIGDGWMGGISAKTFAEEIKQHKGVETIHVRINSPGGSVFDGVAMYNTLSKHTAKVIVNIDGLAASIASIIAMAGDEIYMAENALMMIHDPWTVAGGDSTELRKQADVLDKVKDSLISTYATKSNLETDEIAEYMTDETWLNAAEAYDLGFVDEVTEEMKMAAKHDLSKFKNYPGGTMKASTPTPEEKQLEEDEEEKIFKSQLSVQIQAEIAKRNATADTLKKTVAHNKENKET